VPFDCSPDGIGGRDAARNAAAIAAAAASYYPFERPFLRLKRRAHSDSDQQARRATELPQLT
jgi:peptidoglycan/LPS O-acetylase OafA/YrhL